jgi:acyl-ACP thioesterase
MYKNYSGLSFEEKIKIKPYDIDFACYVSNIVYVSWL